MRKEEEEEEEEEVGRYPGFVEERGLERGFDVVYQPRNVEQLQPSTFNHDNQLYPRANESLVTVVALLLMFHKYINVYKTAS